jgi:hypothetical protein
MRTVEDQQARDPFERVHFAGRAVNGFKVARLEIKAGEAGVGQ